MTSQIADPTSHPTDPTSQIADPTSRIADPTFRIADRTSHIADRIPLTPQQLLDLSTELFARGLSVRFRAPGWSMRPTIRDGEIITVEPIEASEVKKGDIILYRTNEGVIAHRVVGIQKSGGSEDRFMLRGDAARDCDEPVDSHQVLGRVVLVDRRGRHVNPYGSKTKVLRIGYTWASHVKRGIIRISHSLRGRSPQA